MAVSAPHSKDLSKFVLWLLNLMLLLMVVKILMFKEAYFWKHQREKIGKIPNGSIINSSGKYSEATVMAEVAI